MAVLSTGILVCPQLELLLYSRSCNRLIAEATTRRAVVRAPRCVAEGQHLRPTMGRIHGRSEESIHAAYEESRLKKRGEETPPSWVRRVFNFVEFDAPADDVVRRLLVFGSIGYWGTATSRVGAMLFYGLLACIIFLYTKMRDYQKPVAIGFATLIIGLNLGFPEGIMAVQATLVAFFLSCTFLKLPV